MIHTFPQIKIKSKNVDNIERVRQLKYDLRNLGEDILSYSPSDFNSAKLSRLRIRIFKFSRREGCNEFFTIKGNKRYVCLNASLLNRKYYSSVLYTLHGIAHSFCHFKNEIAEEVFCEFVSYSILKTFTNKRGKRFSKRIIHGIMRSSSKDYNDFYRVARKLERRKKGMMMKLNAEAKNRKISKKKQKRIFYRLVKFKKLEEFPDEIPELERGFRKI